MSEISSSSKTTISNSGNWIYISVCHKYLKTEFGEAVLGFWELSADNMWLECN